MSCGEETYSTLALELGEFFTLKPYKDNDRCKQPKHYFSPPFTCNLLLPLIIILNTTSSSGIEIHPAAAGLTWDPLSFRFQGWLVKKRWRRSSGGLPRTSR
jgi:hypothetical protein